MCWIQGPVEEAEPESLSFQLFSGEKEGQEGLKPLNERSRNFSHLAVLSLHLWNPTQLCTPALFTVVLRKETRTYV